MSLTRGQIISLGLERAGRSDLVSNGRLWLNVYLDRVYHDQDFDFLIKDVSGKTLIEGDTLPTDYRAMKTLTVSTNRLPVKVVAADEFEYIRRGAGFSQITTTQYGTPTYAYIDQANSVIHFWPVPQPSVDVYNYFYYFLPTLPDPTDSATDALFPTWGRLSNEVLIQQIYARALEYNDDLRAKDEMALVRVLLDETKQNSGDLRAGTRRFKLGKSHVRKRF